MTFKWKDLDYWKSGEWQVVEERLSDLKKKGLYSNPDKKDLFRAFKATPFDKVRVVLMGQDPYPDSKYATGLAFSIPGGVKPIPPTLVNLLREYKNDLHYVPARGDAEEPLDGSLVQWAERGILLWNAIPSCERGKSLSHDWTEWEPLTTELVKRLNKERVVFACLGGIARRFAPLVDSNALIETSHPSPRGSLNSKTPFLGSRLFSTINDRLTELGKDTIDWRL